MRDASSRSSNVAGQLARALLALPLIFVGTAFSDTLDSLPAQISQRSVERLQGYLLGNDHRALAIASDGAWAWSDSEPDSTSAAESALAKCETYTAQRCMLYSLDEQVVFDRLAWSESWGPLLDPDSARNAAVGTRPGQRMPALVFTDANGRRTGLDALRGSVTVVHFWGSWCPPCMREFPAIGKLHRQLEREAIQLVMLQVRESFDTSIQWARNNGFDELPLYDSGTRDSDDAHLRLADGSRVPDRYLAKAFPTSYVLDRNGIVVFVRTGPIHDWISYLPFLRSLAQRSVATIDAARSD